MPCAAVVGRAPLLVHRPSVGSTTFRTVRFFLPRSRRAASDVLESWTAGWRDPYSPEGALLTWGKAWVQGSLAPGLLTIDFPRWTAVLLEP